MRPLYDSRIEDLGEGDFIRVECAACGHDEMIQLDIPVERIVGRIVAAGYEEPPEGEDFVSWFAVVLVKVLLDEKRMVVSGEELAGMASVVLGFISESSAIRSLQSKFDTPVITRGRETRKSK